MGEVGLGREEEIGPEDGDGAGGEKIYQNGFQSDQQLHFLLLVAIEVGIGGSWDSRDSQLSLIL